jgi:hypothetical protein
MNICLSSTLSNLGGYSVRVEGFAKLHGFLCGSDGTPVLEYFDRILQSMCTYVWQGKKLED